MGFGDKRVLRFSSGLKFQTGKATENEKGELNQQVTQQVVFG